MPPHLHPRSRMTTSLFTTTLMVSFLVVAAPHLIPCPVDPRTLADSADPTGENRRRRRRRVPEEESSNDVISEERRRRKQLEERLAPRRECPVPKPGGLIGQVLGVPKEEPEEDEGNLSIIQRVERAVCKPRSKNNDQ
ncbi:Nn.00g113500.m01.CDS01 [Neocucurbitaria sp. VM-36]